MQTAVSKIAGLVAGGMITFGVTLAGDEVGAPKEVLEPVETRDWCDAFDWLGTPVIKDDNPFIQELKFFGRLQWQWASVDGDDVKGDSFDETFTEWRRMRIGAQAKVFNYFTLKGNIGLMLDRRPVGGSTDFGYQAFDELKVTADIGKMFGTGYFDALKLTYGRQKFKFSEEVHTSSKKIKTLERSAIANKVYGPARPSGFTLDAEKDDWSYTLGLFGEVDRETIGWYDNGFAYYLSLGYQATDTAEYIFDAVWADYDERTDLIENFGYDWALSLAGRYEFGEKWEFMWNLIYGDNAGGGDRSGDFYGLVLMPSYWILDDTLEAVFRYQFGGSEEDEGIRVNSRYLRRAEAIDEADVNGGRGDEHHSFYAGLNWYLCGHNLKIMTGIEYDTLDTPEGDLDAWTYFIGGRTYF